MQFTNERPHTDHYERELINSLDDTQKHQYKDKLQAWLMKCIQTSNPTAKEAMGGWMSIGMKILKKPKNQPWRRAHNSTLGYRKFLPSPLICTIYDNK